MDAVLTCSIIKYVHGNKKPISNLRVGIIRYERKFPTICQSYKILLYVIQLGIRNLLLLEVDTVCVL